MTWQKVVGHINGQRIEVESKDGKRYPVETKNQRDNEMIYRQLVSPYDKKIWTDVKFGDEMPVAEKFKFGDAPWECSQ